ncbi:hypothetical protein LHYA1_G006782 [Lachnellula hyalina]|uniref:Uncharacterized protein n=1 Tax=Lachnellula hyalina TaxID=1316788 RepID=A0A8H8QWG0_9HELO|nr:uncharacterized protein LHYA1_G006782 [Lachnellula hyalina]TVY23791.1 hypothetical protein LHYA1_G006782 [Lachnellula hyalina]
MDDDDEDGGLFNIEVSSADGSANESVKVPRDFQSEEDFQRQRAGWRPKIETGELWKTLQIPIDHPSKPESQTILHAIEELYFFQRYEEAGEVIARVLKGKLDAGFRKVVVGYEQRCKARISKTAKDQC